MNSLASRSFIRQPLIILAALGLALAPLAVKAQPMGGPGGRGHVQHGMFLERALQELDLTDQQRDAVQSLFESNRQTMRNQMQAMFKAHRVLQDTVRGDTYDETAIRQAGNELGRIETEMALARAQMRQQLRKILTPEQFGELEGMQMAMRFHMRDRMRQHRPGPKPGYGPWSGGAPSDDDAPPPGQ